MHDRASRFQVSKRGLYRPPPSWLTSAGAMWREYYSYFGPTSHLGLTTFYLFIAKVIILQFIMQYTMALLWLNSSSIILWMISLKKSWKTIKIIFDFNAIKLLHFLNNIYLNILPTLKAVTKLAALGFAHFVLLVFRFVTDQTFSLASSKYSKAPT